MVGLLDSDYEITAAWVPGSRKLVPVVAPIRECQPLLMAPSDIAQVGRIVPIVTGLPVGKATGGWAPLRADGMLDWKIDQRCWWIALRGIRPCGPRKK